MYNNLNHAAAESLLKEIKDCRAAGGCGEEKLQGILGKYEKLSAERSNAIGQCASRQCVDDIVDSSIRMDDPVSKELLSLLRQTTYDTPGLLQGNPDAVSRRRRIQVAGEISLPWTSNWRSPRTSRKAG